MSWSMSLSGPINVVTKELQDAKRVLESAIAHLEGHTVEPKDTVSVSGYGSLSWDADGKVTSSATGHGISVTPYQAPAMPVVELAETVPLPQ